MKTENGISIEGALNMQNTINNILTSVPSGLDDEDTLNYIQSELDSALDKIVEVEHREHFYVKMYLENERLVVSVRDKRDPNHDNDKKAVVSPVDTIH